MLAIDDQNIRIFVLLQVDKILNKLHSETNLDQSIVENGAKESGKYQLSTFSQDNINKSTIEVTHTDGADSRFFDVTPQGILFFVLRMSDFRVERSNLPSRKNQITPLVFSHFLLNYIKFMLTNLCSVVIASSYLVKEVSGSRLGCIILKRCK
jgi:hypothetical protein